MAQADQSPTTPEIPPPPGHGFLHEVMTAQGRGVVAADIMSRRRKIMAAVPSLGIWWPFEHPDGPGFWATHSSDAVATTSMLAYRSGGSPIHNKVLVAVELLPTDKAQKLPPAAEPAIPLPADTGSAPVKVAEIGAEHWVYETLKNQPELNSEPTLIALLEERCPHKPVTRKTIQNAVSKVRRALREEAERAAAKKE